MTRLVLITSLAVLLAAPILDAQEDRVAEELLQKAQFLMSQERFQDAVKFLGKAVALAPEDKGIGARATLMFGEALAKLGAHDEALKVLDASLERYPAAEFQEAAKTLSDRIREHQRNRIHEGEIERAHAAELENIERDLKARGLTGDELREAYESARQGFLAAAELKRITEMLKLAGISEEEIEMRLARIDVERQHLTEERRRMAELQARREGELALDEKARLEAARRLHEDAEIVRERAWRADREQDARATREELLRLAKRLGIGPEETERFLNEHAPRPEPGGADPRVDDLIRHVEELERKIGDALTSFAAAMEKRNRELEARLARIERALLQGK